MDVVYRMMCIGMNNYTLHVLSIHAAHASLNHVHYVMIINQAFSIFQSDVNKDVAIKAYAIVETKSFPHLLSRTQHALRQESI